MCSTLWVKYCCTHIKLTDNSVNFIVFVYETIKQTENKAKKVAINSSSQKSWFKVKAIRDRVNENR